TDLVPMLGEPYRVRPGRTADIDDSSGRRWQRARDDPLRPLELQARRAKPEARLCREPGVIRLNYRRRRDGVITAFHMLVRLRPNVAVQPRAKPASWNEALECSVRLKNWRASAPTFRCTSALSIPSGSVHRERAMTLPRRLHRARNV